MASYSYRSPAGATRSATARVKARNPVCASLTGWPTTVLSRGRLTVHEEKLMVEKGSGKFIARGVPAPVVAAKLRDGPAAILRKLIG